MLNILFYVLISVLFFGIGYLFAILFQKSKLIFWSTNRLQYFLSEIQTALISQTYIIQNVGNKIAENVEIAHRLKPDIFKISPSINYEENIKSNSEHIIKIQSLAPREILVLEVLTYKSTIVPDLLYIRSNDGMAKYIDIHKRFKIPNWFNKLINLLALLGFSFLVYILVSLFLFLVNNVRIQIIK